MNKEITDEYLIEQGYKQYARIVLDSPSVVARFQKRFDDNIGKKYFIDVIKWSNDYVPLQNRDEHWKQYDYEYEVQITMHEKGSALNLTFFSDWTLKEVENFMKNLFKTMKPNYYELWDGERRSRPKINKKGEKNDKN